MTDEGIFKYIWRINAILVLIVGAGLSIFLCQDVLDRGFFDRGPRYPESQDLDNSLMLSRPSLVGNGKFYLYTLSPGGRFREGRFSSDAPSRNLLVVDAESNESHWMFPDTLHTILSWQEIRKESDCGYESVGLEIVDIREDTNGDGFNDHRDRKVHLVAAGFRSVPRNLAGESVEDFWCEENNGNLFCQFKTVRGMETALFRLGEDMTLIDRSVLPAIPLAKQARGDG